MEKTSLVHRSSCYINMNQEGRDGEDKLSSQIIMHLMREECT